MKSIAVCAALFFNKLDAHSWARCTDYQAVITGGDYDESECSGWIRGWEFDNVIFGQDRGINHQVGVGGGQALCQNTLSGSEDNDYGLRSDKATQYTPGSTVRMVWPAKNHANYECSQNIPDTSMKLFMNPNVNPTSDLPNTASTMEDNGYVLVMDFQEGCQAGSDGCGFQNCRKFCENTDKATCFGEFVVPEVDASGWYTFVWYWIFNPGTPYISCYEAYIDIDGAATTPDDTETGTGVDGTISDYITTIPVCVTGDSYDETEVTAFATSQFSSVGDSVYILSQCDAQDNNGFEFTVQVTHSTPGADVVAIAQDTFCDEFESEFGDSVSCVISDDCGEIITFATYELEASATPSPTEADVVENAITVTNGGGAQAYYYPLTLGDDCDGAVTQVQILKGADYEDASDSYVDQNGRVYAFNYAGGDTFQDLLPITLRLVLTGGDVIVLENVVTDLNGGSTFYSTKTCAGTEISDDTPAPTIDEGNFCSSTPTTDDSDDNGAEGGSSGAVRYGGFVGVCVLVLFWIV